MRKPVLLSVLLVLVSAFAAGCMPNAEGPFAFSPRSYAYFPSIAPGPPSADEHK